MTVIGYWRCSTDVQDQERQIVALKKMNCSKIYGDHISGKSDFNSRPELTKCLKELKSGDLLIISELSRLSRSFLGMVNEISKLLERGVEIKTLDKRLDTTSMPKEITMLIVSILGYAASQELDAIKTRTKEEIDDIIGFFESTNGVTAFDFTFADSNASGNEETVKVYVREFDQKWEYDDYYTLTATLVRVYEA